MQTRNTTHFLLFLPRFPEPPSSRTEEFRTCQESLQILCTKHFSQNHTKMCTWGCHHCFKCHCPTSNPREPARLAECRHRHTKPSRCERDKVILLDAFVRRDHVQCPSYRDGSNSQDQRKDTGDQGELCILCNHSCCSSRLMENFGAVGYDKPEDSRAFPPPYSPQDMQTKS